MERTRISDNFLFFILLALLALVLGEAAIYFLDLNQLIYKDLSEQLTLQQIEEIFKEKTKWAWVGYVLVPVVLFLKITFIAWVLAIGGFFSEVELSHRKYFRIVLLAEFIFLLPALLKIIWFYSFETDFTYERVQQFVPFSLQSVIDTGNIPQWGLYPIQLVNLFEVVYWILLTVLFNKATESEKGMKVVLTGYAPALLVWMLFIMFLTLNISE